MTTKTDETKVRQMIEEFCTTHALTITGWRDDDEDGLQAILGPYRVIEEDENEGLYLDDEGVLEAGVVGAPQHGNEQVALYHTPEGCDSGNRVRDPYSVEAMD